MIIIEANNSLITITDLKGSKTVSARELYLGLGLRKKNWSRWYPTNIQASNFFIENEDWVELTIVENGNETSDFTISIDFAKHISMMAKTTKSHEYRGYFIACEKKLTQVMMQPDSYMIEDPTERALCWIEEFKDKQRVVADNVVLVKKVNGLEKESKILVGKKLEWRDRKIIEALVKELGMKIGYDIAWAKYKHEVLYAHDINLNSRRTLQRKALGRKTMPKLMDMIHDNEIDDCVGSALALCKFNNVNVEIIIEKYYASRN